MQISAEVIEKRREMVASLLARGMTQAEITRQLGNEWTERPDGSRKRNGTYMPNPHTGEAWDKSTICRDVKAIKKQWKQNTLRDTNEWLAEEVATLREARRVAWANRDYAEVRQSVQALAKLLGLSKPEKIEHRYDDDQFEKTQDHREGLMLELEQMKQRLNQTRTLDTLNPSGVSDGATSDTATE